jgi:hypothetical protein
MTQSRRPDEGLPVWQAPELTDVPVESGRRRARRPAEETLADARAAMYVVLILAVVGAALGPVWSWWSGPQQRAFVIAPGKLFPFDEVETMAAADGRFLVIVASVGLLAGLATWLLRPSHRGPLVLMALAVGGLGGAVLTWWTGYLTGGGTRHGEAGTTIAQLPLSLHMPGLLFVEPALAILVYGLFVAFAARDDLGRPDPVRQRVVAARNPAPAGPAGGGVAGPPAQPVAPE